MPSWKHGFPIPLSAFSRAWRPVLAVLALASLVAGCVPAAPPTPTPPVTPTMPVPPTRPPSPTATPVPPPATPTAVADVEIPVPGTRSTLPLHVLARFGRPGDRVTALLRWQDGTELSNPFTLLRGEDGRGLLIGSLDWPTLGQQPPRPPTQPATLELRDPSGAVVARQPVTMVGEDDPDTQVVTLYWVRDETLQPERRRIPRTERIATAALEELLWGPPARLAGYSTALPTPEQVLSFPGREPDWGPRVTLRSLTIENGVATADFSQELRAYGGGSVRVMLISQQIRRTLLEFPTVRDVRIAIEGETEGVLEP